MITRINKALSLHLTFIIITIYLIQQDKLVYCVNNNVNHGPFDNNQHKAHDANSHFDTVSVTLLQQQQQQPEQSKQEKNTHKYEQLSFLYNPSQYQGSYTTRYKIASSSATITNTLNSASIPVDPSSAPLQYFVLNNLNLLFSNSNIIQDGINSLALSSITTVTVAIDNLHVLTQYTIEVSSIPLYKDRVSSYCSMFPPSDGKIDPCVIEFGTCGPVDLNYLWTMQTIPVSLHISSSQFYSFSPNLLIPRDTNVTITISSDNPLIYFRDLYLTTTLYKSS